MPVALYYQAKIKSTVELEPLGTAGLIRLARDTILAEYNE